MKIDPVAIQTYQQVNKREQQSSPMARGNDEHQTVESKLTIEPQQGAMGSKLAVKVPAGKYAEFLSPDEKKALELLFSRFRDGSRFGPGYTNGSQASGVDAQIGRIIDVKV